VQQVFDIIGQLNRQGLSVLLSEQNARGALKIAHRGIVMETGKIRFEGTARALQENPVVQDAYLGVG
jgi:branched-chain amino acid transport system ATP-binding protein